MPLDPRHAVDLLIETIMREEPGTVTLVPTAALTNIAMAARREPRIVERVREVVLMGGAISGGNWSAAAEFNIVTDPEAAHIVVHERWPVTMVGLDVTHQALATPAVRERIAAIGTAPARFVDEVLEFFAATYLVEQGFDHPPVHDPCAVARVIDPTVVTTRPAPLDIELAGRLTTGMTVADLRGPAPAGCTTQVGDRPGRRSVLGPDRRRAGADRLSAGSPGQHSSTVPDGVRTTAANVRGPAVTARSLRTPSASSQDRTASGSGWVARSATSCAPRGADAAGCGVSAQSMRNGTSPSSSGAGGAVRRQESRTPSGRSRCIGRAGPGSCPAARAVAIASSIASTRAAQVIRRSPESASMPNGRGCAGSGCSGSGPITSR